MSVHEDPGVRPDRHDALVDHLVRSAHPVRRAVSPGRWLATWALGGTALTVVIALGDGIPGLSRRLAEPLFVAQLVSLGVAACWCALLAIRTGVPGREPSAGELAVAVLVTAVPVVLTLAHAAAPTYDARAFLWSGLACTGSCTLVGALPWLALMLAVRRRAPLTPGMAGALAGAAALLLAAAATRTACPLGDGRWHFLVWHLAPVALAAGVSAAIATRWLRSWRQVPGLREA